MYISMCLDSIYPFMLYALLFYTLQKDTLILHMYLLYHFLIALNHHTWVVTLLAYLLYKNWLSSLNEIVIFFNH